MNLCKELVDLLFLTRQFNRLFLGKGLQLGDLVAKDVLRLQGKFASTDQEVKSVAAQYVASAADTETEDILRNPIAELKTFYEEQAAGVEALKGTVSTALDNVASATAIETLTARTSQVENQFVHFY